MPVWILLVITYYGGVTAQEFSSKEKCEFAAVRASEGGRKIGLDYQLNAVCVEK